MRANSPSNACWHGVSLKAERVSSRSTTAPPLCLSLLDNVSNRCPSGRTHPSTFSCARKAVSVGPLRDEAHLSLMRLLVAAGQPGAALRQYKELQRRLDEEMSDEPSAPLRALARQIEKELGLSQSVPASRAHSTPSSRPPLRPNCNSATNLGVRSSSEIETHLRLCAWQD